ncbi:hypothetical protein C8Q77DRAFT_1159609 [Trametes polyzona]|nr:hypothetical protein C8Q77DRAFT_1159609 [Trametes polyzona]
MRYFALALTFLNVAIATVAASPAPAEQSAAVEDSTAGAANTGIAASIFCPPLCSVDEDCHVPGCGGPCFTPPGALVGLCLPK